MKPEVSYNIFLRPDDTPKFTRMIIYSVVFHLCILAASFFAPFLKNGTNNVETVYSVDLVEWNPSSLGMGKTRDGKSAGGGEGSPGAGKANAAPEKPAVAPPVKQPVEKVAEKLPEAAPHAPEVKSEKDIKTPPVEKPAKSEKAPVEKHPAPAEKKVKAEPEKIVPPHVAKPAPAEKAVQDKKAQLPAPKPVEKSPVKEVIPDPKASAKQKSTPVKPEPAEAKKNDKVSPPTPGKDSAGTNTTKTAPQAAKSNQTAQTAQSTPGQTGKSGSQTADSTSKGASHQGAAGGLASLDRGRGGGVGSGQPGTGGSGNQAGPSGQGLIASDNPGFQNFNYLDVVASKMYRNWNFNLWNSNPGQYKNLEVTISIIINKDGSIGNPVVERSSGIPLLDRSALSAVLNSNPLPPLPNDFKGNYLNIHLKFVPITQEG